jgi:hypothetical protein
MFDGITNCTFLYPTKQCQGTLHLGTIASNNLENLLFRAAGTKILKGALHLLLRNLEILRVSLVVEK